jgi:hypothetical protein
MGGLKFAGGGEDDVNMGRNYDTQPSAPSWGSGGDVVSPSGAGIPSGRAPGGEVTGKSCDSVGEVPRGGDLDSPVDKITW